MKTFKKTVIGAAMTLALAGGAHAVPINVGGVVWDPDHALDFSSFSIAITQQIDAATGVVSGTGFISTMNGTAQNVFCPGCEVTFQFGGFTPVGGVALPNAVGQVINYAGGWVNMYVDNTPEIVNPADPTTLTFANTGDGQLWLSLIGAPNPNGVTLTGEVVAAGLSGVGQLDVTGGLAQGNFNTNTQPYGSDVSFSNSFTLFFPVGAPQKNYLDAAGTGNYFSNSIPEPGSLALAGLGLLGLGALRRRRIGN